MLFHHFRFILSPRSKEKIAEEVMICEKILDDILSLRIPGKMICFITLIIVIAPMKMLTLTFKVLNFFMKTLETKGFFFKLKSSRLS